MDEKQTAIEKLKKAISDYWEKAHLSERERCEYIAFLNLLDAETTMELIRQNEQYSQFAERVREVYLQRLPKTKAEADTFTDMIFDRLFELYCELGVRKGTAGLYIAEFMDWLEQGGTVQ